jgi:hypothetical protein
LVGTLAHFLVGMTSDFKVTLAVFFLLIFFI